MAEAALSDQDAYQCPVCLDRLKDPVTIACGHSYCKSCINGCWNQEDQKGVYSCPQCRETFSPRPVLKKNTVLAELVDKLKIETQEASSGPCLAGPGDVECDFCTESKFKAVKSCLVCLASFCEAHVQPHYKSAAFKKHNLVKASADLQERICSQHDRLLEVFCRTDQKCICMLCTMDEHKGHDTVSAAAERNEKQMSLQGAIKKFQQQTQRTEKELQELKMAVVSHKNCAKEAVKRSEMVFRELLQSIERCHSEVIQLIRDQENTAVTQADKVIKDLEQEIAEMRRGHAELDQLSHEEDHVHFLQSYQNLHPAVVCKHLPSGTFSPNLSFEDPGLALSALKRNVEEVLQLQVAEMRRASVRAGKRSPVSQPDKIPMTLSIDVDVRKYDPQRELNLLDYKEDTRPKISERARQDIAENMSLRDGWDGSKGIEMDIKDPLLSKGLHMMDICWELMQKAFKKQIKDLEHTFGVDFQEKKTDKDVIITAQTGRNQKVNLEMNAVRALMSLYQKASMTFMFCPLQNASLKQAEMVQKHLSDIRERNSSLVVADGLQSGVWILLGLPDHLRFAVSEIEKLVGPTFDEKHKDMIGYERGIEFLRPYVDGPAWEAAKWHEEMEWEQGAAGGEGGAEWKANRGFEGGAKGYGTSVD